MAKVTPKRKAEHRAAILDAAARMLREQGPDGLGVAAVMQAAGMTHGAFYGHFPSKTALVAEALRHAMQPAVRRIGRKAQAGRLDAFAEGYLSEAHLNDPAGGCPLAALATEIPRQPAQVRAAYAEALRAFLDAAGGDRREVAAEFSRLLGALVLARAAAPADPALAAEILAAARPAPG